MDQLDDYFQLPPNAFDAIAKRKPPIGKVLQHVSVFGEQPKPIAQTEATPTPPINIDTLRQAIQECLVALHPKAEPQFSPIWDDYMDSLFCGVRSGVFVVADPRPYVPTMSYEELVREVALIEREIMARACRTEESSE